MTPTPTLRTGTRTAITVGRPAYLLSTALIVVAAFSTATTFLADGILLGPAVMNGCVRGTALVMLVVALPGLAASMVATARGHSWAVLTWLGTLAYLLYNAVLLSLATPANRLFLGYVGTLSLALWAAVAVLRGTGVAALGQRFAPGVPARGIAVYLWIVAGLNALAWLGRVVPDVTTEGTPAFLDGTGVTSDPLYLFDLAIWIPLMAIGAWWLWQRAAHGYVVTATMLIMLAIESAGIATDQWFGHAADPGSPLASAGAVPVFAVAALIGVVPVALLLRHLDRAQAH